MLIVFDIGNTETTIGLFDGALLCCRWRLTTHAHRTADELQVAMQQLFDTLSPSLVDGAAICSVVPSMTQAFIDACTAVFPVTPIVVTALSPLPLTLRVDHPATTGADRIVNVLAANQLYRRDAIVVDLGTATTYDCVTEDGIFLGGVIQPGVQTASERLIQQTSLLPATLLVPPERTIGTNTVDAIKSGVVFGAADSMDGLIRRIKAEWPTPATPYVIATGGLAHTFRHLCREFDEIDPNLTLNGLRIAYSFVSG